MSRIPLVIHADKVDKPLVFAKEPGRNEKCACGSGRKAKKCCERKHRLSQQKKLIVANLHL